MGGDAGQGHGTSGCVVGVDVGGTSTRALAVRADASVAGRGTSGGANPNSHPPEQAAKRVAEAVAESLGELDPGGVRHCVLGMAGASKLSDPAIAAIFDDALRAVGLRCEITVLTDAEAAYASGTAEPDGVVLISGTGSIAARIAGRRKVATVGGHGWLLGDEGSAFWIGREAVRATLRELESGREPGPLARAVLAEALPAGEPGREAARLITAANAEAPVRLARFAPLVSEHRADPAAADIVERAALSLADQARRARTPGEATAVVLAGSVAGPESPVGVRLRELLAGGGEVAFATDGAAGSAWLAALAAYGPDAPRVEGVLG